jgi:hypothetical protein
MSLDVNDLAPFGSSWPLRDFPEAAVGDQSTLFIGAGMKRRAWTEELSAYPMVLTALGSKLPLPLMRSTRPCHPRPERRRRL